MCIRDRRSSVKMRFHWPLKTEGLTQTVSVSYTHLVSAGLVSARVNARESGNSVSVGKPGHIPKLRHELRAERITYAVHGLSLIHI